jgi:hypothetical protein
VWRADGLRARIDLAAAPDTDLAAAFAALDDGRTQEGLNRLLEAQSAVPADTNKAIRQAIDSELDRLGFGHPLAEALRHRLD